MLHTTTIECALRDRVFGLPALGEGRCWHGALIRSGSGSLRSPEGSFGFAAPALVWTRARRKLSLMLKAGSDGIQLTATEDTMSAAIGHGREAAELRLLADRTVQVPLGQAMSEFNDARHAFEILLRETDSNIPGSASLVDAQLKSVLVILWRNAAKVDAESQSVGRSTAVLQHYRQLVETHFCNHWPIAAYANEIGVSPDRLHDICSRNLGKSPRQLLNERILHEARLMLETTSLSVDQLSVTLGYRDAAYFNRFFRLKVGTPPAKYRRQHFLKRSHVGDRSPTEFADWP